jgi:DNA helicase HerA-like ATPase
MQSHSVSDGDNSFSSVSAGVNGSLGAPGIASIGANMGGTVGSGVSHGETQSQGASHSVTEAQGVSHIESQGITSGEANGVSIARSESNSIGYMSSDTQMHSDTDTKSQADTTASSQGKSHVDSLAKGTAMARGVSQGFFDGIAVGLAPSVSLGDSNQWQFDPAILLTTILRKQQELLDVITREGGYYTDVYALSSTERGKQALMALIPEAFHGVEDVVMGVQTRTLTPAEDEYIRKHAMAMVPSTREIRFPEAMTAYADSTLLTMLQASAYLSPGLFEEGTTRSIQEKIPSFAFDPDLREGITIGLQYSTERGQLTDTLLRMTPERHFHTALIGDTGSGKSVTAERLAYESTRAWKYRTIVLDFGQGWRKALNWPEMEGRVDIRQLYPGAVRPLRWNPLQIPRRIDPVRYRTLLVELFANAGRMGPRQLGFMREALTRVYAQNGVIIPEEDSGMFDDIWKDKKLSEEKKDRIYRNLEEWKYVRDEEEERVIGVARREKGFPAQSMIHIRLDELAPFERQALMIHRSKRASLAQWVDILRALLRKHANDINSRSSLQGVLLRVEQLAEGEMRRMYGPGHDTIAIEDLGLLGSGEDQWGVAVIEGGAEMDEFSKSALLSVIASILYLDAVVRRREALGGERFPPLQIFFEEANKVLSGVDIGAASDRDARAGDQTAQIFLNMWRDGRKYDIFLHVLAQTVSELPQGILSSCNNGFFGQTKDDKDRAAILAYLARSTKGFVNSDYDRFIGRMPMAMAIAKLGYTQEIANMEPYLIRSLMLAVSEPSDGEIYEHYQTLGLVS